MEFVVSTQNHIKITRIPNQPIKLKIFLKKYLKSRKEPKICKLTDDEVMTFYYTTHGQDKNRMDEPE
jgi:hypothetical protein